MKLLLYCTKAKPYITKAQNRPLFYPSCVISDGIKEWHLNGKIIAECDFEVEEIESPNSNSDFSYILSMQDKIQEVCSNSCLTKEQLFDYVKWNKEFYAIHIKNLHIFDKSRELSEYKYHKDNHECYFSLGNAPQNMMYCYEWNGSYYEKKILISIRPEWLCKILNREKTIEVRKKVLKEVLINEGRA